MTKGLSIGLALLLIITGISLLGCVRTAPPVPAPQPAPTQTPLPKPVKLKFITSYPETDDFSITAKFFLEEVTRRTKGMVTFDASFGGTAGSTEEELYFTKYGMADLTGFSPAYYPDVLKLATVGYVPYIAYEVDAHRLAMLDLIRDVPELEREFTAQNVRILFPTYSNAVSLASTRRIGTLADLSEMKIGAAGVYDQIALQQWGAIPVSLSTEEIYNALAEGIVDASFGMTPQDFVTIGAQDTAKYFIETGYGTAGPLYTVINIDSYNKLTPDIQRILDEVSNEAALKHGEIRTESIRKTIPEILNAGGEIYALSAEIQAELYTSAKQPSRSAWIRNMIKAKANVEIARQVLALYIQFVDKYKSRSTSKEIVEIYIQELGG